MSRQNARRYQGPDHLWQVALSVQELLSRPGVMSRWRDRIVEWLQEQNADIGHDEDGNPKQRLPSVYVPLPLSLNLVEKYVVLAAVHDYAADTGTERIVPIGEDPGAACLNVSYIKQERERLAPTAAGKVKRPTVAKAIQTAKKDMDET